MLSDQFVFIQNMTETNIEVPSGLKSIYVHVNIHVN